MKITRGPNQLAQQANDEGGPRHIKHKQNTNDTRQNEKTDKEILVYVHLLVNVFSVTSFRTFFADPLPSFN